MSKNHLYCAHCGEKIDKKNTICQGCGRALGKKANKTKKTHTNSYDYDHYNKYEKNPKISLILSIFLIGSGQIYNRQILKGTLFAIFGYGLIGINLYLGLIFALYSIYDVYKTTKYSNGYILYNPYSLAINRLLGKYLNKLKEFRTKFKHVDEKISSKFYKIYPNGMKKLNYPKSIAIYAVGFIIGIAILIGIR